MADIQASPQLVTINSALARRVLEETGQNVYLCYQCVKCTSGCPMVEFFDWQPNQIMRSVQLGQDNIALTSKTPWMCASCQTCSTRCPQGLDIALIMEFLLRESMAQGKKPLFPEIKVFDEAFLREVRLWGRSYELGLMVELKLRTLNLFGDLDLAVRMLRRNKLPFLPGPSHTPRKVRPVKDAKKSVAYYPGCSLHSTSAEYNTSTLAVCQTLGLELKEPKGWVCCGAAAAHRSNPGAALRLPMLNLKIVEQSGFDEVTMPCTACFSRHKIAQLEVRQNPQQAKTVEKELGYAYQDQVQVNTLVQTILKHVGKGKINAHVKKSLQGLRVVCYYGCLLTRPPLATGSEHPENPTDMDELVAALGVDVRDWSYKTVCCGADHSLTRPEVVFKLSGRLIENARQSGADAIVVSCPLCHTNLDARQTQMGLKQPMPVFYFTQLMALAFGIPESAALYKNLIDPRPMLKEKVPLTIS